MKRDNITIIMKKQIWDLTSWGGEINHQFVKQNKLRILFLGNKINAVVSK